MIKIGLVGAGFMGATHAVNINKIKGAKLVAICDLNIEDLKKGKGGVAGNIDTGGGIDFSKVETYTSIDDMLANADIDVVDICIPTPFHAETAIKAMKAGKHVLCEKPMASSVAEANKMIQASKKYKVRLMIAQCLRFWPEYEYLKEAIDKKTFGELRFLNLQRYSLPPTWAWNNWYMKGKMSGGAALDLHIHDIDMLNYLLGKPKKITAIGKKVLTGAIDIIFSNYEYKNGVVATLSGSWVLPDGFNMSYYAVFEKGTIEYNLSKEKPFVVLDCRGKKPKTFVPKLPKYDGYFGEIKYFINCLTKNLPFDRCTPESTRDTLAMAFKELESINTGKAVRP